VVGLYRTLLGFDGFKKGLKLYFERFDGKAVACDDFRQAMAGKNTNNFIFLFLKQISCRTFTKISRLYCMDGLLFECWFLVLCMQTPMEWT
jgi:hypothetical protein